MSVIGSDLKFVHVTRLQNTVVLGARISPSEGPATITACVPRYHTGNPTGGVTWDRYDLTERNRFGTNTKVVSRNDSYFDLYAMSNVGVYYEVKKADGTVAHLQEPGQNTFPTDR